MTVISSAPHVSQAPWTSGLAGPQQRLKSVSRNVCGRPGIASGTLSLLSTYHWPKQVTWSTQSHMTKPKSHSNGVDTGKSEELGWGERCSIYNSAIKQQISNFFGGGASN